MKLPAEAEREERDEEGVIEDDKVTPPLTLR
jgi:hypothetical protein